MGSTKSQNSFPDLTENSPLEKYLFWGMVLLHAGYIWLFDWFPTQDGPSHVDNAVALFRMLSGEKSILNQYYLINTGSYTNWLGALLLGALTKILPNMQAEKALLCGYLILLPVSFRYALGGIGRNSRVFVFFIFPLLYNRLFFSGFHSFCYSLVFFLITIGYWFRRRDRISTGSAVILSLLILVTMLWHLFSLVMAGLVIGSVILGDLLLQWRKERGSGEFSLPRAVKTLAQKSLVPAVVFLPSLILVAVYLGRTGGGITNWIGPIRLVGHLVTGTVIFNFGWWGLALSLPYLVSLGLVGWLVFRPRKKRPWSGVAVGLTLNCVLVTALYLVTPDGVGGGGTISFRLALYTTMMAVVMLAGRGFVSDKAKSVAVWAPVAISFLFLVFRYQPLTTLNEYLDDYLSGLDHIESGTTIFPISFLGRGHPLDRDLEWRTRFFTHAGGYISATKGGVNLRNYEGRMNYFPLLYKPGKNPYTLIGMDEDSSGTFEPDLLGYPKKSGGQVDYVLLWCYNEKYHQNKVDLSIIEQMERGYNLSFVSPRGLMRIYKLR